MAGATALAGLGRGGPALSSSPRGVLIVCGWQLLWFALFFGLAWIFSRASPDAMLCRWRGGFWIVPLSVVYSVALRVAVGIVLILVFALALLLTSESTPESVQETILRNKPDVEALVDVGALRENPAYFWLAVTVVSFGLGGLREELWRSAFLAGLRALWPHWFGSTRGQILGVSVAAVLFGFAHLPMGVLAVGMTGLLGLGLGIILVLHRSIWPAVLAHGFFNATTMALLPLLAEQLRGMPKPPIP